jgi:hypothetical protein
VLRKNIVHEIFIIKLLVLSSEVLEFFVDLVHGEVSQNVVASVIVG